MVGVDILLVDRIEDAAKNENFIKKTLLPGEEEYLNNKSKELSGHKHSAYMMTLAGLFAAKEAVLKAFGLGITNGYGLLDVEIKHNQTGEPVVCLSNKLESRLKKLGFEGAFVTLSHDGDYAVAFALLK